MPATPFVFDQTLENSTTAIFQLPCLYKPSPLYHSLQSCPPLHRAAAEFVPRTYPCMVTMCGLAYAVFAPFTLSLAAVCMGQYNVLY
jgi:hypothetical protein